MLNNNNNNNNSEEWNIENLFEFASKGLPSSSKVLPCEINDIAKIQFQYPICYQLRTNEGMKEKTTKQIEKERKNCNWFKAKNEIKLYWYRY